MSNETEVIEDKALWKMALYICGGAAAIVSVISFVTSWHWLGSLWFNYSWPSDKGNGPEALQQTIVYFAIAAIFVPVVRKFIRKEFHNAHAVLHAKLDLLHEKTDHIIHEHPDIPDFVSRAEKAVPGVDTASHG